MNYYEELGVGEQATEVEIRKAHRRLVKLMHPDAQRDQNLKLLAESQMRRLNSIVATLLDPAQRQEYDRQIVAANSPAADESSHSFLSSIPWWLTSAVAAVVLTLAAIWLWADHLGNSFGAKTNSVYVPPIESRPANPNAGGENVNTGAKNQVDRELRVPPEETSKAGGVSATVVSDPSSAPAPSAPIVPARETPPARVQSKPPPKANPKQLGDAKSLSTVKALNRPVEAKSKLPMLAVSQPAHVAASAGDNPRIPAMKDTPPPSRKVFALPAGAMMAQAKPMAGNILPLPSPPGVSQQSTGQASGQSAGHDYGSAYPASALPSAAPPPKAPDVVTSASTVAKDPLEGEWVYAPKEPERRRPGFYPPEFIDLKLFGSNDVGSLKGRYSAKYLVTDKPVSPEVTFELAAVNRGSRKFVWQSANGAKGTLNIDPIDDRTIRIDWHTTSSMPGPALTSGQATLVRRQ